MNENATQVNQLVTQIAQYFVDRPQDVLVNTIEGTGTMVLELQVAKDDVGKVIGKQGRTAKAMRIIIGAVSSKLKNGQSLKSLSDENQRGLEKRITNIE